MKLFNCTSIYRISPQNTQAKGEGTAIVVQHSYVWRACLALKITRIHQQVPKRNFII